MMALTRSSRLRYFAVVLTKLRSINEPTHGRVIGYWRKKSTGKTRVESIKCPLVGEKGTGTPIGRTLTAGRRDAILRATM